MQLHYIPVTAFPQYDLFLAGIFARNETPVGVP